MPDLQTELQKVVSAPRMTCRQYIIRALTEKPGSTGIELMDRRPSYMPKSSVSPMLTYMARAGVVRRAYVSGPQGNGHGATFAYWIENANAPISYNHKQPLKSKGNTRGKLVGASSIGRTIPEEHSVLEDADVKSWKTMGGGVKPPTEPIRAPTNYRNEPQGGPSLTPKPEANMVADGKPRIVVQINNKQRIMTIPEARELYAALKDLFG